MILFLNTADFAKIHFVLVDKSANSAVVAASNKLGIGSSSGRRPARSAQTAGIKILQQKLPVNHNESGKTLPALIKFLQSKKAASKISKIYVVSGPGSFSGIRVGIAIALAFGFAWNLPVYALNAEQIPKNFKAFAASKKARQFIGAKKISANFNPNYGAAPKITKEKIKKLKNT